MTERWPRPEGRDDDPIAPLDKDHVDSVLERLREHRSTTSRHVEGSVLGQGGMGIVLEVRDADLRRPLALKRLHPKRRTNGDVELGRHYLARFLQEAQVTGQLAHPGIPPVHELSIDDEGPYFTMPVIRGQNLDEVFAKARAGRDGWSTARALGVLLKVCEAMAFAHAKHVVHRDLKPENVRIGRFGEVYVMDWGLARVIGRGEIDLVRWSKTGTLSSVHTDREDSDGDANAVLQTLDGDVLGTPFYMPPEQARGELERVGPQTDVYAVGGLLYLLLTGRAPYQPAEGRISARTVLAAVLHGPPPSVVSIAPEADADLVAICEKAMARDMDARYASMEELASDIEAWIDRRPIQASAPSLGHALRLFAERHRAAVMAAAAGVLALVVSGSWFVWRVTAERDEKEAARVDAQRRGDAMAAAALDERERELWPALPDRIPALEAWIADANDLLGREAQYKAALASATGLRAHETEAVLRSANRVAALLPQLQFRLASARSIQRVSIVEAADSWKRALADLAADVRFQGVARSPRLGLVPLWKDERSGLWEFWLVASGSKPSPGPRSPEDGVVLVLLPPGVLVRGSVVEAQGGRRRRWQQDLTEVPVRLGPFLCGKFEITQSQWERLIGTRPSRWQPGVTAGAEDCPGCPVESISWVEALEFSRRLGLRLPSEDEWEFACRAGSPHTEFVYGPDTDSLRGHENVRDSLAGSVDGAPAVNWSDGFAQVAPVGSFHPNGFGLHDMLGNVTEWCSDEFLPVPDSEKLPGGSPVHIRVFRGGSWYASALTETGRAWYRQWDKTTALNHARGLRLVMDLGSDP